MIGALGSWLWEIPDWEFRFCPDLHGAGGLLSSCQDRLLSMCTPKQGQCEFGTRVALF